MTEGAREDGWMAGWIDGLREGRSARLFLLRRELSRFDLAVDEDEDVVSLADVMADEADVLPQKFREPPGDPTYDAGFQAGHDQGTANVTEHFRAALIPHGLHLTEHGIVVPVEGIDELLRNARMQDRQALETGEFTDELLHEFLDAQEAPLEQPTVTASPLQSSREEELPAPPSSSTKPARGLLSMTQKIKRRSALVAAAGMLTTTLTVGYFRWLPTGSPQQEPTVEARQAAGAIPPWSEWSAPNQAFLDQVEAWVAARESAGEHHVVADAISRTMRLPADHSPDILAIKEKLLIHASATNRRYYVPAMGGVLKKACGSPNLIAGFLTELEIFVRSTRLPISSEVRETLRAFSQDETRSTAAQRQIVAFLLTF